MKSNSLKIIFEKIKEWESDDECAKDIDDGMGVLYMFKRISKIKLVDIISARKLFYTLTNEEVDILDAWTSRHNEALTMITLSDIVDLADKYEQHLYIEEV